MARILLVVNFVLLLVIGAVLAWKYRRIRDSGLLWLIIALVVWPVLLTSAGPMEHNLLMQIASGHPPSVYPFTLVAQHKLTLGELVADVSYLTGFVGLLLELIAVALLYRRAPRLLGHPA